MKYSNKAIANYYDDTTLLYRLWFVHSNIGAMHYGIAASDKQSFNETLINTNRYLAKVAGITSRHRVLDAGCGIGGSSLWLAGTIGCHVTGISLSKNQIARARQAAQRRNLSHKTDFLVMDYTKTDFADASFDVVWGLESVCHAGNKDTFFREAYRVLKPGGRLAIGDGFSLRAPANRAEARRARRFEAGFVVPPLSLSADFEAGLAGAGFTDVVYRDKTAQIAISSKRMYRMAVGLYPLVWGLKMLHMLRSYTGSHDAAIAQYRNVKDGLYGYGVVTAQKP